MELAFLLGLLLGGLTAGLVVSVFFLERTRARERPAAVEKGRRTGQPARRYAGADDEVCVCCGAPVPEGRMICKTCERKVLENGPEAYPGEKEERMEAGACKKRAGPQRKTLYR